MPHDSVTPFSFLIFLDPNLLPDIFQWGNWFQQSKHYPISDWRHSSVSFSALKNNRYLLTNCIFTIKLFQKISTKSNFIETLIILSCSRLRVFQVCWKVPWLKLMLQGPLAQTDNGKGHGVRLKQMTGSTPGVGASEICKNSMLRILEGLFNYFPSIRSLIFSC